MMASRPPAVYANKTESKVVKYGVNPIPMAELPPKAEKKQDKMLSTYWREVYWKNGPVVKSRSVTVVHANKLNYDPVKKQVTFVLTSLPTYVLGLRDDFEGLVQSDMAEDASAGIQSTLYCPVYALPDGSVQIKVKVKDQYVEPWRQAKANAIVESAPETAHTLNLDAMAWKLTDEKTGGRVHGFSFFIM